MNAFPYDKQINIKTTASVRRGQTLANLEILVAVAVTDEDVVSIHVAGPPVVVANRVQLRRRRREPHVNICNAAEAKR